MKRLTLAALACGLVTACDLAPAYRRPDLPPPTAFKEGDTVWAPAQPADLLPRGSWWQSFGDPELDALEQQASAANQELRAAFARYEEARAIVVQSAADFLPTVTANASFSRNDTSRNSYKFSKLAPKIYNDYLLTGDVSYEIDVWGRVRNAVKAADAQAKASAADFAATQLSIEAEVAADYVSVRTYDTEQALLDDTVGAYRKALELTRNRFRGGVAAETDVDQAETQLENALTQSSDTRLKRAQSEHAIAVLIGEAASSFSLPVRPLQVTTPAIAPGLPSQLLQRRPDVAENERQVFAANAQIGVARTAYFPVFSLNAMFGLESAFSSNLVSAASKLWSFGPGAAFTVFDGGRRAAITAEAHAAYDLAVANYRNSVLVAYQEVEDNLVSIVQLDAESATQEKATIAAKKNLNQANLRYKGGLATYLEVSTAQTAALQAELGESDIRARRLDAGVQLIKAIGGGWTDSDMDAPLVLPVADPSDPTAPPPNGTR